MKLVFATEDKKLSRNRKRRIERNIKVDEIFTKKTKTEKKKNINIDRIKKFRNSIG